MYDSLFDKNIMKKFDDLSHKQAKLTDKKDRLAKNLMEKLDSETIYDVINIVKKYGHPREKKLSQEIEFKYSAGEKLDFDDLMLLDSLYKSNMNNFNKGA